MGSISVCELKQILEEYPDDYEVIMELRHKYDIPKTDGERGWIAFVNGIKVDEDYKSIYLMN